MSANTAMDGLDDTSHGMDEVAVARGIAVDATAEAAAGAAHITRGVDATIVADRLATLSDVVGVAGVTDIAEGAELISTAEDVEAVSAVVGLMSVGDLDRGLELGRLSGEIRVISDVIGTLRMPVIAAVLSNRGRRLQNIAVDVLLRAAATRSLSKLIDATGQRISEMGEQEMDEGALRLAAADITASRAAELGAMGMEAGLQGIEELEAAGDELDFARSLSNEGISDIAEGSAELGSAETMHQVAQRIDKKRK